MHHRTDDKPGREQSAARRNLPLVFLHGFLGARQDWDGITQHLREEFTCIALDLEEEIIPQPCHLIGYSMGGRRALQLKKQYPTAIDKVVVLSAHPGLTTEEEKEARWKEDLLWMDRLEKLPFEEFLELWYDQPLFGTLKHHAQFPQLLQRKRSLDPQKLIHLLCTFSLAKQERLWHLPQTLFLYGQDDAKYAGLSRAFIASQVIEGASHALHIEKPEECAALIRRWICSQEIKRPNSSTRKALEAAKKGKTIKAKDFDDICNQLGI